MVMPPTRAFNFHQLEVFHTVARLLNFSRAAEELYISQPAVSKQVKELEKALGTQLFRREGRRVQLTDAGRVVYDYAAHAFVLTEELRRAIAELQGPGRGYLRLAATCVPATYLVPRVLAAFQERYPEVHLSVEVSGGAAIIRQVLQHHVDLGIIDSAVVPADVHWQPFATIPVALVASPDHPLSIQRTVKPADLGQETIIVEQKGSGTREAMEQELDRLGVQPARTIEISNVEAIKRAVAANLGLAFLPLNCVQAELDRGELKKLALGGLSAVAQLGVISAKGRRPSATVLAFVALLRKTVGP
jgi:DNA-binding transcriptional LysR family regulator